MRIVHNLILYTAFLYVVSGVQGKATSRGIDLEDVSSVGGHHRPLRVGRRRHLSQTSGKKNKKEISVENTDSNNGKTSADGEKSQNIGDSEDTSETSTLSNDKDVKAVKKARVSDKSSVSRLRKSKPNVPKKHAKKNPSKKKRRKTDSKSRSMHSIRKTGKTMQSSFFQILFQPMLASTLLTHEANPLPLNSRSSSCVFINGRKRRREP